MNDDVFSLRRRSAACLSDHQVSKVVCGDLPVTAAMQQHIAQCEHCGPRIKEEQEAFAAQVYEPLPKELLPKPTAPSRWQLWLQGATAAMAACVAVALTVGVEFAPKQPGVRLKGETPSLSATVKRGADLVFDQLPIETLRTVRPGDKLRLKLAGPLPAWVILQGWEDGAWVTYYAGAAPADRWLPMAIELTDQGSTRLRLLSCSRPVEVSDSSVVKDCEEKLFTL